MYSVDSLLLQLVDVGSAAKNQHKKYGIGVMFIPLLLAFIYLCLVFVYLLESLQSNMNLICVGCMADQYVDMSRQSQIMFQL